MNLTELAIKYGTDKAIGHNYTVFYDRIFADYRHKKITLLEIGVGGDDHPDKGGESLSMWRDYFERGKIYAIDINDKSYQSDRVQIFKGDQSNEKFLSRIMEQIGSPDIIIDDGSHYSKDVIKSFEVLFPYMPAGGIYVVEDTQVCHWNLDRGEVKTVDYFQRLAKELNYKEFTHPFKPSYFNKTIYSIQFVHNLIVIYKGLNTEESNIVVNNQPNFHTK